MVANLDELNDDLNEVVRILGDSTRLIVEIGFSPEKNVELIGRSLWAIMAVQQEIYTVRPDLTPPELLTDK